MGRPKLSFDARFWEKTVPEPNSGCLLWDGGADVDGYGITSALGHSMRTHRVAWIIQRGPIPDGMQVLHRCDVPPCVNVNHLFLGTNEDNRLDQLCKGRSCSGERNGRAKLTSNSVREIRFLSLSVPGPILARRYGVTHRLIYLIRDRKAWKHLT